MKRLPATSDWRIQKSLYLAEVRSIEERLTRLTDADFAAWHHGPWSLHVRETLERLCQLKVLQQRVVNTTRSPEAQIYEVRAIDKQHLLDEESRTFLAGFVDDLEGVGGNDLVILAKATVPFKRADPETRIDLDAYLREMRAKHAALQRSKKVARLVESAASDP